MVTNFMYIKILQRNLQYGLIGEINGFGKDISPPKLNSKIYSHLAHDHQGNERNTSGS